MSDNAPGAIELALFRIRKKLWLWFVHPFILIGCVTRGGLHTRWSWYIALHPSHSWLRVFRPEQPKTNAPWLSADAIAYRRAIGRKEPFLG